MAAPVLMVFGALISLGSAASDLDLMSRCKETGTRSVHDFHVMTLDEKKNVTMARYAGKPLLIINVATY